jgi:hypothetical protein
VLGYGTHKRPQEPQGEFVHDPELTRLPKNDTYLLSRSFSGLFNDVLVASGHPGIGVTK